MVAVATLLVSSLAAAAPTEEGLRAWVANRSFDAFPGTTVTALNLEGAPEEANVATGREPTGLAVADAGQHLLVTNRGDNTLSVIDAGSSSVLATVRVGVEPQAVAVAPRLGRSGSALVANFSSGTLTPVDLSTWRAGRAVDVGSEPVAVAVAPGGTGGRGVALVCDFASGSLVPVDLGTMREGRPIPVGPEPDAVAVGTTHFGPVAVVADFGDAAVTFVSLVTGQPGPVVGVPGNATSVAVRGQTAWVAAGASLVPVSLTRASAGRPVFLRSPGEALALTPPGVRPASAWVAQRNGWLVPVVLGASRASPGRFAGGHPTAVTLAR